MKLAKRLSSVLLLLVVLVWSVACSTAATPAATGGDAVAEPTAATGGDSATEVDWSKVTSAAEGGGMEALVAAAQAEGNLHTIALPRDWCNYGEMIDAFSAKYGIAVNELNPDAGSADEYEAIRANKDAGGPQAPDVVDVGLAFGPQGKEEGLLAPYKVEGYDSIDGLKDDEGYWYSDYGGVLVIQVNKDLVSTIPTDWADLLKPEYQGQIALAGDPRASNQAMQTVFAAGLANGGSLDDATPGLDFFRQVSEAGNFLPVIATSGTFAKGETPITFAWNYLGLAARDSLAGNPEVEIVYPTSGIMGGFYVQGVSAYAPNPAAARLWQEFLYSDEGQKIWMRGYCVPARFADMSARGVIEQELLDKMPAPGVMESAVFPTVEQLDAARTLVQENWDSSVGVDVQDAPQ